MENMYSQIEAEINELQNNLSQPKKRKRGPNLNERIRADIYQAYLENVDEETIAAAHGLKVQTIRKAIREKEEQQVEAAVETPFVSYLELPQTETEMEPEANADNDFEPEAEQDEENHPEPEPETEVASAETQPNEVEYVDFPPEVQEEPASEESVAELEGDSEKDIEIEALLVHYIFSLYDANVLSPFEAATFIRRL